MSYCVNCGVELEASMKACPLCNTPIIHSSHIEKSNKEPAFPSTKGQVEVVKRQDFAILLSVILIATGVTCGLLNLFVFRSSQWSFFIIGACILLWVLFVPMIIYGRISVYISLLFDGIAIGFYLYLITFVTMQDEWFLGLALPITALTVFIGEIFALCIKKLPVTFLTTTLYIITSIGALCIGLELLIDRFLGLKMQLVWSAVVLTVCVIIDITLITLLSRARLRNEVRRRLHF